MSVVTLEVLPGEFLKPMRVSAYRLSKETGIPQTRISEITHGRRRVTADTSLRLSKYFGTSARFWMGLEDDYDLEEQQEAIQEELKRIETVSG